MGLHDAIKDLDEQLKEEEGVEKKEEDSTDAKEQTQDEKDTTVEEEAKTDDGKTDEGSEEKSEEEEINSDEGEKELTKAQEIDKFYNLRREKDAEKRRADELQARIDQANQPKAPEHQKADTPASDEPDPEIDPEAHLKWQLDQTNAKLKEVSDWKAQEDQKRQNETLRSDAVESFSSYEDNFKANVQDYDEVTAFGVNQIAVSIARLRPDLKGAELGKVVQNQILRVAGQAQDAGYDPAEYFYNQSKLWGYQPQQAKAEEAAEDNTQQKLKPDVKTIAKHKKRSLSSHAGGGKDGKVPLSKEAFANMGFAEVARLSPSELAEWEKLEA